MSLAELQAHEEASAAEARVILAKIDTLSLVLLATKWTLSSINENMEKEEVLKLVCAVQFLQRELVRRAEDAEAKKP